MSTVPAVRMWVAALLYVHVIVATVQIVAYIRKRANPFVARRGMYSALGIVTGQVIYSISSIFAAAYPSVTQIAALYAGVSFGTGILLSFSFERALVLYLTFVIGDQAKAYANGTLDNQSAWLLTNRRHFDFTKPFSTSKVVAAVTGLFLGGVGMGVFYAIDAGIANLTVDNIETDITVWRAFVLAFYFQVAISILSMFLRVYLNYKLKNAHENYGIRGEMARSGMSLTLISVMMVWFISSPSSFFNAFGGSPVLYVGIAVLATVPFAMFFSTGYVLLLLRKSDHMLGGGDSVTTAANPAETTVQLEEKKGGGEGVVAVPVPTMKLADFAQLLKDPEFDTAFESFLRSEFNGEHLYFVRAVNRLVQEPEEGLARKIFEDFVPADSVLQINVAGAQRVRAGQVFKSVEAGLDAKVAALKELQVEVLQLLFMDSLKRFKKTPAYQEYKARTA